MTKVFYLRKDTDDLAKNKQTKKEKNKPKVPLQLSLVVIHENTHQTNLI